MWSQNVTYSKKQQREGKPHRVTTQFQLNITERGMPFINFLDAMSVAIKSEIILLLSHQKGDSSSGC